MAINKRDENIDIARGPTASFRSIHSHEAKLSGNLCLWKHMHGVLMASPVRLQCRPPPLNATLRQGTPDTLSCAADCSGYGSGESRNCGDAILEYTDNDDDDNNNG